MTQTTQYQTYKSLPPKHSLLFLHGTPEVNSQPTLRCDWRSPNGISSYQIPQTDTAKLHVGPNTQSAGLDSFFFQLGQSPGKNTSLDFEHRRDQEPHTLWGKEPSPKIQLGSDMLIFPPKESTKPASAEKSLFFSRLEPKHANDQHEPPSPYRASQQSTSFWSFDKLLLRGLKLILAVKAPWAILFLKCADYLFSRNKLKTMVCSLTGDYLAGMFLDGVDEYLPQNDAIVVDTNSIDCTPALSHEPLTLKAPLFHCNLNPEPVIASEHTLFTSATLKTGRTLVTSTVNDFVGDGFTNALQYVATGSRSLASDEPSFRPMPIAKITENNEPFYSPYPIHCGQIAPLYAPWQQCQPKNNQEITVENRRAKFEHLGLGSQFPYAPINIGYPNTVMSHPVTFNDINYPQTQSIIINDNDRFAFYHN